MCVLVLDLRAVEQGLARLIKFYVGHEAMFADTNSRYLADVIGTMIGPSPEALQCYFEASPRVSRILMESAQRAGFPVKSVNQLWHALRKVEKRVRKHQPIEADVRNQIEVLIHLIVHGLCDCGDG